ncbi:MAG: RtcB family protein [Oscillospiraceae bacterium]|nr:RtcB family protein [Oscillospiraceae bacterium]
MKLIETPGLHIKSWCDEPEAGAIEQAKNIAQLPFAHQHIALMPDTHQGYGMPIGGVLAAVDTIIPNAVGVDIGCGMLACKTTLQDIRQGEIRKIMGLVRESIPTGFHHRKTPLTIKAPPKNAPIVQAEHQSAQHQVGTLGGGNHFIEIQRGSDGHIWFMIHSGSRNLGKKVCDHYNALAKRLHARWPGAVPAKWDLAFLPIDTEEGQQYIAEMEYCQQFAAENRRVMFDDILGAFEKVIPGAAVCDGESAINVHHNYARLEHHFGKDVWVHRKGATSAQEGEMGIIPGSQGTKSYIVTGLGNQDSFCSCSHGAGRKMGRKEAQRTLSLEAEIAHMDKQGIVHGIRNKRDLDEAAGAYKDIDVVMEEQKDLVEIAVELTPLGVIKA